MKRYSTKPPESPGPNRGAQSDQKPAAAEQREQDVHRRKTAPLCRVNISGRSGEIAALISAVNRLPEVRDAKVRLIKQRVDAGTYVVDPRKVAEKILSAL